MKLPMPVESQHQAFCTKGCHGSFYLSRCLVCENEKPGQRRKFCRRPKCQTEHKKNPGHYSFPAPGSGVAADGSRSAHLAGLKTAHKPDPVWRVVAGPVITANIYHCATVAPDEQRARQAVPDRTPVSPETPGAAPSDWKPCLPSDHITLPDLSIPDFLRREQAALMAA
jgi:hypothetical protein